MTQKELSNIILKTQCCIADMAYKSLKAEMFLKNNTNQLFKNVKYAQSLLDIMNRYYDVMYIIVDIPCITSTQLDTIIQKIQSLCDSCGCCTDSNDLLKDI